MGRWTVSFCLMVVGRSIICKNIVLHFCNIENTSKNGDPLERFESLIQMYSHCTQGMKLAMSLHFIGNLSDANASMFCQSCVGGKYMPILFSMCGDFNFF